MINMTFLWGAIAIMLIVIISALLKKYYGIATDSIDCKSLFENLKNKFSKKNTKYVIKRNTGNKSLKMLTTGENKATVLATLRQITGIDYDSAKNIVDSVPSTFMTDISEQEADITKQALEFVGAKIEVM